jgi:hypothetical protein
MAYKRKSWIRGRKCTRKRRVRVKGQGMALRCVAWGPKRSGGSSPRRSKASNKRRKARGRRPWNKGKRCQEQGIGPSGKIVCRSYGKIYLNKTKNRRRSIPNVSDVSDRSWGARVQSADTQRWLRNVKAGTWRPGTSYDVNPSWAAGAF